MEHKLRVGWRGLLLVYIPELACRALKWVLRSEALLSPLTNCIRDVVCASCYCEPLIVVSLTQVGLPARLKYKAKRLLFWHVQVHLIQFLVYSVVIGVDLFSNALQLRVMYEQFDSCQLESIWKLESGRQIGLHIARGLRSASGPFLYWCNSVYVCIFRKWASSPGEGML